ncbi:MAG TPA: methyltransferase domain-containing protein [Burkholderiales bacterium]|nr:methyltransferase domain-containing protein [Burkholderiales bacterium]
MSIRSTSERRVLLLAVVLCAGSAAAQDRAPDINYVPTPMPVVERMLELTRVGKDDVVYDLGSGDGRIVITAAQRYGARGVGIELNPVWVRDARAIAERVGVADRVAFRIEDLFETDLRDATVVALYLFPTVNAKLQPKLARELKPGTRVVSHEYRIGDWLPDRTETLIVNGRRHEIHFWTVPAR